MKDVTVSTAANLLRFLMLGPDGLWKYINNVPGLAPVEGGLDWTKLPDDGIRNCGILIFCENDLVYRWNDIIPIDVPDARSVLERTPPQSLKTRPKEPEPAGQYSCVQSKDSYRSVPWRQRLYGYPWDEVRGKPDRRRFRWRRR